MFIPGVTAHRLFTPPANWNIENMCYDVDYFYVGAQEVNIRSVIVRPDGTQFFIAGLNLTIYSYTMSTAWDLSTAIYDNKSFNLGEDPYTLLFNPTGTRLIYSINGELIYQRDLSVAWDVTTLGAVSTYDPAEETGSSRCGMFIDTSGTKMYWGSRDTDTFYQYTLLTPWDITTAIYDNKSYDYSAYGTTMDAIWFNGDGSKWLLTNSTAVLQFSCSTNWDISTSLYDSVIFEYGTSVGADGVGSMRYQSQFANNGTYLYSGARVGDYVFRYRIDCDCPTIADLRYNESGSVTAQETGPQAVSFNLLGTKMFIGGSTNSTIFQYTLSIPWDVSSSTYDSVSLLIGETIKSIVFNSAGTKMTYAVGGTPTGIEQRTLSTPYDLSTAGSATAFYPSELTVSLAGHDISPDGTKMYIVGRVVPATIYQYTLETPWDVTTAVSDGGVVGGSGKIIKLTFDNSTGVTNLDDFPLLVRLNSTDVPGLDLNATEGADIRFYDPDGTELKYEVEDWDDTANTANVWVKVPRIDAGSTSDYINMHYNLSNATYDQITTDEEAVWSNDFLGVWHLSEQVIDEQTSGTHADATGNYPGNQVNNEGVAGHIGTGQEFDGDGDYIDIPASDTGFLGELTLSVWANITDNGGGVQFAGKHLTNGARNNPFDFRTDSSNRLVIVRADAGGFKVYEGPTITEGSWKHYAVVLHDNLVETFPTFYIDGVAGTTVIGGGNGQGAITGTNTNIQMGERIDGGADMNGIMDEFHISMTARPADWIEAEYLNQKDSSTFISFGTPTDYTAWFDNDWKNRVKVTIDNSGQTTDDLTNFPLLVRLNVTDFPGLDLSTTAGADVRFTSSDGTELKYEVEGWDNTTNIATVWVKVPTITVGSTTGYIYVYYNHIGSATYDQSTADEQAVWDTNHAGVWHMDGTLDSTANGNDSTIDETSDVTGQIGQGREWSDSDRLSMGSGASLDNLTALTFSTWLYQTDSPASASRLFEKRTASAESTNLYIQSSNRIDFIRKTTGTQLTADTGSFTISNDTWYHVTLTTDGTLNSSGVNIYIDGVALTTGGGNGSGSLFDDAGGDLWIGSRDTGDRTLRGTMDEVRMSNVVRSANWISASYLNQKDSSTYTSTGDVESNSKSLDVSVQTLLPGGISWCASGKRFFITNGLTDILQYSATDNWDISTGIYQRLYNPATNGNGDGNSGYRRQTYLYQDGTDAQFFFNNASTDSVYRYTAFQWGLSGDY